PNRGGQGWLKARLTVPGTAQIRGDFDRNGPNYTEELVCFTEAFDLAAATLKDRQARYGVGSPDVKAWLVAQDAGFESCNGAIGSMPPLPAGAPAWLAKDHDYQAAAKLFYQGQFPEAAKAFSAIGRDPASPWRGDGRYLEGRSLFRLAVTSS